MYFLNPTYLWAFFGLLLPVVIHLWNKKESKTIQIGSIQLLNESKVKKSKHIQFNELFLLLLRLFMLSVLVLILAAPQIKKQQSNNTITYLVEHSLVNNDRVKMIVDSLKNTNEVRWLEEGFPEIKDAIIVKKQNTIPNYWQLAKTMDDLRTDSIVVFTKALVSGIKGIRPETRKPAEWIIIPDDNELKKTLKGIQKENELELFSMSTSNYQTVLNKEYITMSNSNLQWNTTKDSLSFGNDGKQGIIPINEKASLSIQIFNSENLNNEKKYIKAAFNALSKYLKRPITITEVDSEEALKKEGIDLTVWLSEANFPKEYNPVLAYKPNDYVNTLIEESVSTGVFYITKTLNTENVVTEHLTTQLLTLLTRNETLIEDINALDRRQLALEELRPKSSNKTIKKQMVSAFNVSSWLWPLLMVLLIGERILSKFKQQ